MENQELMSIMADIASSLSEGEKFMFKVMEKSLKDFNAPLDLPGMNERMWETEYCYFKMFLVYQVFSTVLTFDNETTESLKKKYVDALFNRQKANPTFSKEHFEDVFQMNLAFELIFRRAFENQILMYSSYVLKKDTIEGLSNDNHPIMIYADPLVRYGILDTLYTLYRCGYNDDSMKHCIITLKKRFVGCKDCLKYYGNFNEQKSNVDKAVKTNGSGCLLSIIGILIICLNLFVLL